MGKYSLLAIDRTTNSERIIWLHSKEKDKEIEKFNLSEIDCFTSSFNGELAFNKYLREQGIETFDNVRYCIVTTYDKKDYYFKVIFNSQLINNVSKNVKAGYISVDDNYRDVINSFYSNIDSKSFQESIENTNYIKGNLKQKIIKYISIRSNEKNHVDEYEEQTRLSFEINEEFKRYKTFRGLYLFLEKYKRYGYVEKPEYSNNNNSMGNNVVESNNIVQNNNVVGSYKEPAQLIASADDYNQEYDEFLTEDEYSDAYGEDNATQYIKGARHD